MVYSRYAGLRDMPFPGTRDFERDGRPNRLATHSADGLPRDRVWPGATPSGLTVDFQPRQASTAAPRYYRSPKQRLCHLGAALPCHLDCRILAKLCDVYDRPLAFVNDVRRLTDPEISS